MKTRVLIALLVIAFGATACLVGVDVSRDGKRTPPSKREKQLRQAKRAFKKAKKWKEPYDAWQDAVDAIGAEEERALGGAASVRIIRDSKGIVTDDVPLIEYVNDVANLVALQGERKVLAEGDEPRIAARRFFVTILKDEEPVAFSAPAGHLFVSMGLLDALGSESELAWVLGHEIAHVDWEHGLTALKARTGMPAALAKIDLGSIEGMEISEFLAKSGIFDSAADTLGTTLVSKAKFLSRAQEDQADATGLEYATAAGYDAAGALRALEALDLLSRAAKDPKTHRPARERAEALSKLVKRASGGKMGYERWQENVLPRLESVRAMETSPR